MRRVTTPVSRDLEISEITDRVSKGPAPDNKALLFERVEGSDMPVLINTFGSARRMAWALGAEDLNELSGRVEKLLDLKMPGTFFEKLKKLGALFDLAKAGPKRVSAAPCQEVAETRSPSLKSLPIIKCWPGDAGYYITLPLVFTRDPERGTGVEMVKCKTIDLEVPAQAEIVLEGFVDPKERRLEGPFGDHTGYYSLARDYPVFHLTAITHRRNPIYPTIIVGRPPQEDYWLGKATERLFLPIIRMLLPEVVDMNMPAEGIFHNLVIVSIKKRYPGQARKVMYALWGLGLMMLAKNIVVVSEHVNVHDLSEVAWRTTGNIDPKRDLVIVEGPMDDLDHAALRHRYGGKLGVDATEKGPLDDVSQDWPDEIVMSDEIKALVSRRWKEYGF